MDSLPEIELAMEDYPGAITEAIEICRLLLLNVNDAQSNYQSMDSFLASISGSTASSTGDFPSSQSNPFCTTTRGQFRQIHDMYKCTLQSVRSSHRRVSRKLKILKALKKLSRALVVTVCGVGAAAAFGTATAGILRFERKSWLAARAQKQSGKTMSLLLQQQEKLDAVAKGTYVLGWDLDTISSLVARLSDGIERENALARCCVERAEDRSSVLEMANELRHSCSSSRRLVEELEEHVCMFLATVPYIGIEFLSDPRDQLNYEYENHELVSL